ncbi:MAG: squalene/phytoene synthase family protein [Anaerolineae bacterium]|nr:squalene/phytoene synthase family protein [Anaerolineae bacterium]
MTTPIASWENRLFALAHEPLHRHIDYGPIKIDREILERAYARSAEITKENSKTFYLASALLPAAKRRAMRAHYAFCRTTDDIVDRATGDPTAELETWRDRTLDTQAEIDNPIVPAWRDTLARYRIPSQYAHQLIDGVAKDLSVKRYASFDELSEYAYGVASTVGLISMHIVGFQGVEAIPYAIKLGVALQLTNILRDIKEDWDAGRLYLPQDELSAFDLSEADIARGQVDDRWRAFMRFQIERNRRLYQEAVPGIALLHRDGRFAIAAAAELYRAILADIEARDYNVFAGRAFVSRWGKLRRLPGIWWRARTAKTNNGA